MNTKIANEYSTNVSHNENIVSLDPESIVDNLQNYLDRDRKKSLINQANHYIKRLSFSRALLLSIQAHIGIETPAHYEIKGILEAIDSNIELIKNNEQVDSFSDAIAEVAKTLSEIEKKTISFSADTDKEIVALRNEVSSYSSTIGQKVAEVRRLEEKISSVHGALSLKDRELETAKNDLTFAKNELQERVKSTTGINSELSKAVHELHALKTQLSDKEIELREMKASLNTKTKENSELVSELLTMEISLSTIKEKFHDIRTEKESFAKEVQQLRELTSGVTPDTKMKDAGERIHTLEKSIRRQEAIANSKTQELETVKGELAQASELLKEKTSECIVLKEDISKKQHKFERSKMSMSDTMYQLEMAKRGLDTANQKIDAMDRELGEARENIKIKERELSELSKDVSAKNIKTRQLRFAVSIIFILIAILSVVLFLK